MNPTTKELRKLDRLEPTELWDDIEERTPGPEAGVPVSRARRLSIAGVALVIAGAAVGLPIWALSNESDGPIDDESVSESVSPRPRSLETPWFVAPVPEGWSAVTDEDLRVGQATFAAQLTNFPTDGPICLEGDGSLPPEAVLLRLSIGWEAAWESNLILPSLDPELGKVPNDRTFVDDCGAAAIRLAIFFGPDGQQIGAHALIGEDAQAEDVAGLTAILERLAPSGEPVVEVPGVTRAITRGADPDIGEWAVTFRRDFGGAVVALRHVSDGLGGGFGAFFERPEASPFEVQVRAFDDWEHVLIWGVVGADAERVEVQLDDGRSFETTLVPFDEEGFSGQVFWMPPVEGSIQAEGTQIEPDGVVVVTYPAGERDSRPIPG